MEEEGCCLYEMKHRKTGPQMLKDGRSQETVERQAAEWTNSERGRHKRIVQKRGQGMGEQVDEHRGPWGYYKWGAFQIVDIYLFNTSVVIIHVQSSTLTFLQNIMSEVLSMLLIHFLHKYHFQWFQNSLLSRCAMVYLIFLYNRLLNKFTILAIKDDDTMNIIMYNIFYHRIIPSWYIISNGIYQAKWYEIFELLINIDIFFYFH